MHFLTGCRASSLWDTWGPGPLPQTRQPYQSLVPGWGRLRASLSAGGGQLDSWPGATSPVYPDNHSGPPSIHLWTGQPCVVSGWAGCVSGHTASAGDVCSSSPRMNKRLETACCCSDPSDPAWPQVCAMGMPGTLGLEGGLTHRSLLVMWLTAGECEAWPWPGSSCRPPSRSLL